MAVLEMAVALDHLVGLFDLLSGKELSVWP
jgi:hypothetical protein